MWTPRPIARALRLRVAIAALSLALPSLVAAAPGPQSSEPATSAERRDLRQAIEKSFEVLPISGGVLLKPRQDRGGVKSVELKGDEVAVNGTSAPLKALPDWLEDRAEPVLRLHGLKPLERLTLLGLQAPAGAATEEPVPAVPTATETEVPAVDEENGVPAPPVAPEPPAEPDSTGAKDTGDRVNVGGGVTVDKGEKAEQVVAIGGPARVEGEVERGVVSVGNSVHINAKVGGDVVAVGGSVYLGPEAEVDGDVTSVGGSIQRDQGSKVHGATTEVGLFPFLSGGGRWHRGWNSDFGRGSFFGGFGDFVGNLMWLVFLCFLGCMVVLVARQPLERVLCQLKAQPWQSVGVGFLGSLAFVPALIVIFVALAITLVGCLLYPFLLLFLALVIFLGYTAVALRIGESLEERFQLRRGNPYVGVVLGILVLHLPTILGGLFGLVGGPFRFFGVLFSLAGFMAGVGALIVGFGAVILARFGTSPGYWPGAGAPVVPLIPTPPSYPPAAAPDAELPLSHAEPSSGEPGNEPPSAS